MIMIPISLLIPLITAALSAGSAAYGAHQSNKQFKGDVKNPPRFPTVGPEQQQLIDLLTKLGGQGAQSMYGNIMQDPNKAFDPMEDLARKNYMEKTIPSLSERFVQGGGQRGSAFARTLGSSGADLDAQLQAQRSQFGENRYGMQQSLLNTLLSGGMQRQFEPIMQNRGTNPWSSLGGAGMKSLPNIINALYPGQQNQQTKP
jgi:hypothetical protein